MGIKMQHDSRNTCIFFSKIETDLFLMNNENGKEAICFIFPKRPLTVTRTYIIKYVCIYIYIIV